jgi:uncharacterized protein
VGEDEALNFEEVVNYTDEDLKIISPVKVSARLVNTGKTILLAGTAALQVELTCCRCLRSFIYPVKLELDEEYGFSGRAAGRKRRTKEIELKDADFVFAIESDNTIDLFEAIRQNLISAIPMKPLCREKCKGILVPERNKGLQKEKKIDPRLEKLREFKKK